MRRSMDASSQTVKGFASSETSRKTIKCVFSSQLEPKLTNTLVSGTDKSKKSKSIFRSVTIIRQ